MKKKKKLPVKKNKKIKKDMVKQLMINPNITTTTLQKTKFHRPKRQEKIKTIVFDLSLGKLPILFDC